MKIQASVTRKVSASILFATVAVSSYSAYSASNEFTINNGNPNGVWNYGHSTTLGGAFSANLYAVPLFAGVVDMWSADISATLTPHVSRNVFNSSIGSGTVILSPLQLVMHPGPNNEFSVLRFNAPCCGDYQFDAAFVGVDWIGTTTDVHVLKNGVLLWSGGVNGYQATAETSGFVRLECGDTLDVAVGAGSNNNYFFDTTGVEFDINQTSADPGDFDGFFAPLGGADATGGSFAAPLRSVHLGSNLPVKFTAYCCEEPLRTGAHTLTLTKYHTAGTFDSPINATSTDGVAIGNQFRLTGNQWHYNLSTSGLSSGIWKLTATLSGGIEHVVWIRIQ